MKLDNVPVGVVFTCCDDTAYAALFDISGLDWRWIGAETGITYSSRYTESHGQFEGAFQTDSVNCSPGRGWFTCRL